MDERYRLQLEMFEDELSAENVGVPDDHHKVIEKYAQQIINMDDASRQATFERMAKTMPVTYGFVFRRVNEMMQAMFADQAAAAPDGGGAPNQQEPGTRAKDQVEIKGEQGKGATKGNV